MSTVDDQPRASRARGYSRGWRLSSVILLRSLLRLLARCQWQGREGFPREAGAARAVRALAGNVRIHRAQIGGMTSWT